jgi:indolepyruvate ferredoxin oxidoreductase alpha subunit
LSELLTGNEAIARGAYECGVKVAAAYPGTPSTEILENFARYPGIYAEWAPNEKVAVEVGIGASMAGARTMVAMKHVGMNVAADPLFTLAYTGVNGGLVLVCADDPGMHSSQNEQDNRYYARFIGMPLLEPGDSREARDMVGLALDLSEEYDLPVMLRITTRVAHSQSFVELKEPLTQRPPRPYVKDEKKYLMVPAFARLRREALAERLTRLKEYAPKAPVNWIEWGERSTGVITSGVIYQYVREVLPDASVLKLGMTNPLPEPLIREFADGVAKLVVVEELEPFIEEQVRAMGLKVSGSEIMPKTGELDPGVIAEKFMAAGILPADTRANAGRTGLQAPEIPARPPVMCPGCPHRGIFHVLRGLKLTVTGDIGCYTLGGLPPLSAMDTAVCMGASIGMAHGISKANPEMGARTVAVIGDSTFFHSGLTGVLNLVYNKGTATVIILDNRTTAMTGHQPHAGTGSTLMGEAAPAINFEVLMRALGVKRVRTVNPLNLAETAAAVREETAADEPSVIIAQQPCVLLSRPARPASRVEPEKCKGCKLCLRLGCPAISLKDGVASVDAFACTGCGLCIQVCKEGAIAPEEDDHV